MTSVDLDAALAGLAAKQTSPRRVLRPKARRLSEGVKHVMRRGTEEVGGLQITPLSEIAPRRQGWVWDGRIPAGELTLLAGPEGVGKSTLIAWLVAEITRGTLTGILHGRPQAVLLAALEDDAAATLRPRIQAAGADLPLVGIINGPDGGTLRLPEHLEHLEREVQRRQLGAPVGALIIDPVKSTAVGVDPDKELGVRPLLGGLLALAQTHQIAVLASAHFKKGSKDEDFAAWKVSGTPAWTQVPRSVMFFAEDPDASEDDPDARLIAHAKCNVGRRHATMKARVESATIGLDDGPLETSRLKMGGVSSVTAAEFGSVGREQRGALGDAAEFLRHYLSDGEEHERSVVVAAGEAEGHAARTLLRALTEIGGSYRRTGAGSSTRTMWRGPARASPDHQGGGASGGTGAGEAASALSHASHASGATVPPLA